MTSREIRSQDKNETGAEVSPSISPFILKLKNGIFITNLVQYIELSLVLSWVPMKKTLYILVITSFVSLSGCGPDLPFEANYTSKNRVVITYQGKQYALERYGIPMQQAPFTYRFEKDGDLDLTLNGQTYDIDSPYDIDKKKKKKVVKKSSTASNNAQTKKVVKKSRTASNNAQTKKVVKKSSTAFNNAQTKKVVKKSRTAFNNAQTKKVVKKSSTASKQSK
ncbi:MAG: hypothetical protein D3923_15985 [Candidatus Electrothrix sp. AR3]|nr:hypothetical protein [Candidatus Electrothrix sp. AR3]